ncbi:MAG: Bax inhibitor-1/YccA family protein [Burkholderiales bacterium]
MEPRLQNSSPAYQIPTSTDSLALQRHRVLRNTYLLLAITLIPTMIGATLGINISFAFLAKSPVMSSILILGGIYGLFFAIEANKNSGIGVALLLGLTFLMGVLLGPLLQAALSLQNGGELIGLAAGGTAAVFFVLAGVASSTKRDFGYMGHFLMVGAVVLMLAVVANIFFANVGAHLAICAGFVLFSSMLILFQVNQIVRGGETNYISATLTLYISIYNLFTSLLQLLMAFSGNRQ